MIKNCFSVLLLSALAWSCSDDDGRPAFNITTARMAYRFDYMDLPPAAVAGEDRRFEVELVNDMPVKLTGGLSEMDQVTMRKMKAFFRPTSNGRLYMKTDRSILRYNRKRTPHCHYTVSHLFKAESPAISKTTTGNERFVIVKFYGFTGFTASFLLIS